MLPPGTPAPMFPLAADEPPRMPPTLLASCPSVCGCVVPFGVCGRLAVGLPGACIPGVPGFAAPICCGCAPLPNWLYTFTPAGAGPLGVKPLRTCWNHCWNAGLFATACGEYEYGVLPIMP